MLELMGHLSKQVVATIKINDSCCVHNLNYFFSLGNQERTYGNKFGSTERGSYLVEDRVPHITDFTTETV